MSERREDGNELNFSFVFSSLYFFLPDISLLFSSPPPNELIITITHDTQINK